VYGWECLRGAAVAGTEGVAVRSLPAGSVVSVYLCCCPLRPGGGRDGRPPHSPTHPHVFLRPRPGRPLAAIGRGWRGVAAATPTVCLLAGTTLCCYRHDVVTHRLAARPAVATRAAETSPYPCTPYRMRWCYVLCWRLHDEVQCVTSTLRGGGGASGWAVGGTTTGAEGWAPQT